MRIRCAVRLSLLFQCSRHTHNSCRSDAAPQRTRMWWERASWNRRSQTMSSSFVLIGNMAKIVRASSIPLNTLRSVLFDSFFCLSSSLFFSFQCFRWCVCFSFSHVAYITASTYTYMRWSQSALHHCRRCRLCVSPFQFSSTKSNEESEAKKKTFRFCFPIPNHKPTDSAASTHTLTPAGTYKLKNPHIYPHPILPRLRLAQMLFCRTSFTFCLCTFFFLPVCVCLHSIFHFTFHSTLPVLLVSTTSENFVLFRFTAAFNLGECVCVHHLYSVRVSCLRFCRLHRSTFIIEILFLVCFAFLCSLDCNQVAHSQWV